jgi:hypothetical protein
MYLYEQEGEQEDFHVDEGPMTFRLKTNDDGPPDGNGEDELLGEQQEGEFQEGEEGIEPEELEEESPVEEPTPEVQSTTPRSKRGASSKKKSNLMHQLQLHMTPQQQQRFHVNQV